NTNRQGFTLMDVLNFTGELSKGMRNGGGGIRIQTSPSGGNEGLPVTGLGQSQQGVATTVAGGGNYNNTWDKGKTDLNLNVTSSDVRLLTDETSNTQNLTPTGSFNTLDTTGTLNKITQQHFGGTLDRQVDSSFSFRLIPSLTWQRSDKTMQDRF